MGKQRVGDHRHRKLYSGECSHLWLIPITDANGTQIVDTFTAVLYGVAMTVSEC